MIRVAFSEAAGRCS